MQREPPCDLVIYGASLRCLSVNSTAAANLTWRGVPAAFQPLRFTAAQTALPWAVSQPTSVVTPAVKTQLGEPADCCRAGRKKGRNWSSRALAGGRQGAIVDGIQFLYTVTSEKGRSDSRGKRLAFSLHRGVGRVEAEAQAFPVLSLLCDHLTKWQQPLFIGTFPPFGDELWLALCLVCGRAIAT